MKKSWVFLSIVLMILFVPLQAHALYIVDTGEPDPGVGYALGYSGGWPQYLAVKFVLDQQYTLTDVDAWIYHVTDGDLTFAVYAGDDNIPSGLGSAADSYSQDLFIHDDVGNTSWRGISGLNWVLPSGTYWLSLEARGSSEYSGSMAHPAPYGANYEYAYWSRSNGYWIGYDLLNVGFQIQGNPGSAVPEPATMLLLGFGLIGLAGLRRKFRK